MIKNRNIAKNAYIDPTKIAMMTSIIGDTYYVAKSGGDIYNYLIDRIPDSDHLKTTITAGCAALTDYDTLIITPGNYDEAATVTLTGLKSVKILGFNNGMQWGEGSTNWRSVTSTDDLLNITGCQGIEIAGIGFIQVTNNKDAINFTGLNYSTHIHDCCFVGDVGGGAVMAYGINIATSDGPDTYVHDCRFFRVKTAAIQATGQRNVIKDNIFFVPASGKGIVVSNTEAEYTIICDNHFIGAQSSDVGISFSAITAGNFAVMNNLFANVATEVTTGKGADAEQSIVWNHGDDGDGGLDVVDPS